MVSSRRDFLRATTVTALLGPASALAGTAPSVSPRNASESPGLEEQPFPIQDSRIRQLVHRALDAARSAGAAYADVRISHLKRRTFVVPFNPSGSWNSSDWESMTVGVRALVNGYWGFASGPLLWSDDEMVRLGRAATNLAKTDALGKSRPVDLGPATVVADGHWTTPVTINPFDVSRDEISDFLGGLYRYGSRFPGFVPQGFDDHSFLVTDKAFGSTDGSYWTQRLFRSGMKGGWKFRGDNGLWVHGNLLQYLSPAGKGWELYKEQPLRDYLGALYEELKEDASFPVKPVDIGRYEAVFDPYTVAGLLASSIGAATQLDRAMGYEANADGTSYLVNPEEMLGTYTYKAPLLTVTANRTTPGAAATVQWDDDGVAPDVFPLVQGGIVVDFLTTRESAGWMRSWKLNHARPFRSHGCASAPEAVDAPLAHTPNLAMTPGASADNTGTFVQGIRNGILVKRGNVEMDFQQLNGYGIGDTYEIRNGKRVARVLGAGFLLRAPEFWESLRSIGGRDSVMRYTYTSIKGAPPQKELFSVDAPPISVGLLTVIDQSRKA